jgi:hypothetical protein
MAIGDRRDYLRRACAVPVQVCSEDGSGNVTPAECVDLSRTGARLKSDAPIETFSKVRVTSEQPGFPRSGVIRYCARQSGKFVVGVHFTDAPPSRAANPNPSHN